jgi:hypothetical protein
MGRVSSVEIQAGMAGRFDLHINALQMPKTPIFDQQFCSAEPEDAQSCLRTLTS